MSRGLCFLVGVRCDRAVARAWGCMMHASDEGMPGFGSCSDIDAIFVALKVCTRQQHWHSFLHCDYTRHTNAVLYNRTKNQFFFLHEQKKISKPPVHVQSKVEGSYRCRGGMNVDIHGDGTRVRSKPTTHRPRHDAWGNHVVQACGALAGM